MTNYETSSLSEQIFNPMPPSFEKSPRTGFIHPLGTDNLGRDVYSELLYGARAPLVVLAVLVLITLAVGVVIWIAATYAARLPSGTARIIGGFSSIMADYVIAVPILVVFMTRWYRFDSESASLYILLGAIPLLVWACSFRVIRVKMPAIRRLLSQRQTTGVDLFALRSVLLKAAGSILYIGKFVVLFGFLTMLIFPFFISYRTDFLSTSWAWLSEQAYDHANAIHGDWWLVFPQLVLAALLAGGVYTMLDTFEQVMVRRFGSLE
jgi:peptide/nickel transport system permease protein